MMLDDSSSHKRRRGDENMMRFLANESNDEVA